MVQNETLTEADQQKSDNDVWTQGPDGELIPDYDSTFPIINEGEVVRGKVVRVDKDEVLIDIGYKSEGVIPVSELSIRRSVNPADEVQLGDEIDALVMTKEDAEGRLILSKKRARVARGHSARPGSRRVHGPDPALQGDRAQPQPQQRRPFTARRARGGAQGDAPGDPRPALAR